MRNVGLLGLGTVGTGILEILKERNIGIRVKKVLVNDINKNRNVDLDGAVITDDFNEILNDPDIRIIVEVTSNVEQSYENIKKSLESGKHVVTANKAIVSRYFEELSGLAEETGLAFLYEASVGGGIPVIKPLKEQLKLNEIAKVQGILNGTCNYILSRMFGENLDYTQVLKMAQELGYAEANPSADVDGYDTQRKLRILGTLALKGKITEEDILLDGISSISAFDIEQIKKINSTVKLIGQVESIEDKFTAVIQPTIISNDSYFASVNMAFNSVAFEGNNVGGLKFYGSGAGKLPTANAVLSDVLDIVNNAYRKESPLGRRELKNGNDKLGGRYYLRTSALSKENMDKLDGIKDSLLSSGENTAIITKEVLYKDLLSLIAEAGLNKGEYFIGRILE